MLLRLILLSIAFIASAVAARDTVCVEGPPDMRPNFFVPKGGKFTSVFPIKDLIAQQITSPYDVAIRFDPAMAAHKLKSLTTRIYSAKDVLIWSSTSPVVCNPQWQFPQIVFTDEGAAKTKGLFKAGNYFVVRRPYPGAGTEKVLIRKKARPSPNQKGA